MMNWKLATGVAFLACVSQPAVAGGADYVVQAIPAGQESARFDQGVATVDLEQRGGAVQVTPLGLDHGNLTFGIAVFNSGSISANIDIGSVSISSGGQGLVLLSTQQLVSKAKSRAVWKQIGLAVVGGLSAGLSASQRNTYHATTHTPYGSYSSTFSAPSLAGQLQAQRISADTAYGLQAIRDQLDRTRQAIGQESLQLSTVGPGESYAGKVMVARFKPTSYPQRIDLSVTWNGELYRFAFQIARDGTPQPAFPNIAVPHRQIERQQSGLQPGLRPGLRPAIGPAVPLYTPAPMTVASVSATPMGSATPMAVAMPQRLVGRPVARPVMPAQTSYEQQLAAQQGVRGREPKQGWTVSD